MVYFSEKRGRMDRIIAKTFLPGVSAMQRNPRALLDARFLDTLAIDRLVS